MYEPGMDVERGPSTPS
jgi:hypothetical protein